MLRLYGYHGNPDLLGLYICVIAPAVALLCWLFNARKLGWLKKWRQSWRDNALRQGHRKRLLLLAGLGLLALAALLLLF